MTEVLREYWPILIVIAVLGLIIGLWLLRPRQRVQLSASSAPIRPHMDPARDTHEGSGIADEAAAATSDVAGEFLGAQVHRELAADAGPADDLQRLKGVGPRLSALLNDRGISRFDQLASLSEADLAVLDRDLGSFKGRLARDRVVQQAGYLARGDVTGFEQEFGKL